jgi:hypothetical protein
MRGMTGAGHTPVILVILTSLRRHDDEVEREKETVQMINKSIAFSMPPLYPVTYCTLGIDCQVKRGNREELARQTPRAREPTPPPPPRDQEP